jgi:arylsulfatase A-like enzyme
VPDGLKPPEWAQIIRISVKDAETRRTNLSGYFAAVTAMDANIGRLLDGLEKHGLRENTLVVFMSDNGMNMGHHGVYGKGNATLPLNMFDTSVKVPMLVSQPNVIRTGETCSDLLSQYDFFPTLLDYLGLPNPEADRLPGISFAPVLRGANGVQRDEVVVFDEYGPVRMIRTREWKYVHRYPCGPNEIYNLPDDPEETRNLIGAPEQQTRVKEMQARLEGWFARWVDPKRDGVREPVTGQGQIGLVGPDADSEKRFTG